jgi:hypothetical protein
MTITFFKTSFFIAVAIAFAIRFTTKERHVQRDVVVYGQKW